MKVLLISTNFEKTPFAVAPLGAVCMVSALKAAGHDVAFLDLCFSRYQAYPIQRQLKKFKPDIVALSIRNLDNCSFITPKSYFQNDKKIVASIRQNSDATIVIGGSGVTVSPQELAEYLGVEYAFVSEGEKSLPAFLEALDKKKSVDRIPGLWMKQENRWKYNPPDFVGDLDGLPSPAYHQINYRKYFSHGGFVAIQTKRGCSFKCIYCTYRILEGGRLRFRSPGGCVDEMEKIVKDTGASDFFFTDGVFNWPPHHALSICQEIIRRKLKIRWLAYCNPSGFDDELASAFKASGCAGIELGLDAVTEKMLISMGKGFSRNDIKIAYQSLLKSKIPFAVFLLLGGPNENYKDWAETQKILNDFGKANAVFASLGIRIYKDTPVYDLALCEGVIAKDTNILAPVYYLSPQLQNKDLVHRLDTLARQEPTWSSPLDWDKLSVRVIQKILGRFRKIPSWENIEGYGAHMRRQK